MQLLLSMSAFVGFSALAVDGGMLYLAKSHVQTAADASALAAAARLGDGASHADVQASAVSLSQYNKVVGHDTVISASDVSIGIWDPSTDTWTTDPYGTHVRVLAHGRQLPTYLARILGVAQVDVRARAIAAAETSRGGDGPPCLLFGDEEFNMNGSLRVDGYNSMDGYRWHAAYYGTDRAPPGVGCSNADSINLAGSVDYWGDLHAGPGGEISVRGSSQFAGDTDALEDYVSYEPVDPPHTWNNRGISGDNVWGTHDIRGTMYFRDGLTLAGGTLRVTGPTEIYVEGDLSLNGGAIENPSQDPNDLTIYVLGDHDVNLRGSHTIYGSIYAPDADVRINGSTTLWGALIGGSLNIHGSAWVHVDVSLEDRFPTTTGGGTSSSGGGALLLY